MRRWVVIGLAAVLVVAMVLIGIWKTGVFDKKSNDDTNQNEVVSDDSETEVTEESSLVVPETSDVISAVSSYSYIERHNDDSFVNYVIYPVDSGFAVLTKYKGVGGGYYYHTQILNSDAVERFKDSMNNFTMAQEQSSGSGAYTKGVLTLTTSSGQSIYNIAPIDISGYGLVNPWSDDIREIVTKPDCVSLFNTHQIESVAGIVDEIELYSYIQMVYDQIKTFISDDIVSIDVNFDADNDVGYQLLVHIDGKDDVPVNVLDYGYVKGSIWQNETVADESMTEKSE